MKIWLMILLGILVGLNGCSSQLNNRQQQQIEQSKLYQLYIDEHGNLLNPASKQIVTNDSNYVNRILLNFKQKQLQRPDLNLTIFIHGGLNTFESATSRLERVKQEMLDAGKYPLFISWNSGPFTNYGDHLFYLRRGEEAPILGPLSSPFVFLEDALRSVARLPASTYNVLFSQNSVRINKYTKEEKASDTALINLKKQGFIIHNNPNDTGHSWGDWATVWNPFKLVTAPFVDGLGTGAWDSMLRRTDLVLTKDSGFDGHNNPESDTAVTLFLNRFSQEFNHSSIDIIGHSMGSIVANNIIAKYPDVNFQNIVYMAAACRIKDLEYVVAPYLEHNKTANFYGLSLNPYRDISENTYYDFVPRGSLLIWIDQTLGNTNSFQDRTAGFWFNMVRSASQTFKTDDIRKRVHLTQFGIKDGTPQNHGDFSNYKYWDQQFWIGNID